MDDNNGYVDDANGYDFANDDDSVYDRHPISGRETSTARMSRAR